MKVLVIIPAYNEGQNIKDLIDKLKKTCPDYEYIIINDGSVDDTKQVCQQNNYCYVDMPINSGIGVAVQTGYRYAFKNDFDIAVQLDGDGQHDPKYLSQLIKPLEEGKCDVVIGSRFIEKKGFQSSSTRRIGIKILSMLIKICTGVTIKDVTSGYRAVNRRMIEIYVEDYSRDYPEPEAIITAVMHKAKVLECPVEMLERQGGISSINFSKSLYYMIKVSLAILLKRIITLSVKTLGSIEPSLILLIPSILFTLSITSISEISSFKSLP